MIFDVTTEQHNTIVSRLYLRLSSKTNSIRLTSRNTLFSLVHIFWYVFLSPIPKRYSHIHTHTNKHTVKYAASTLPRTHASLSFTITLLLLLLSYYMIVSCSHTLSLSLHSNTNNVESSSSSSSSTSSTHYFTADSRSHPFSLARSLGMHTNTLCSVLRHEPMCQCVSWGLFWPIRVYRIVSHTNVVLNVWDIARIFSIAIAGAHHIYVLHQILWIDGWWRDGGGGGGGSDAFTFTHSHFFAYFYVLSINKLYWNLITVSADTYRSLI